LNFCGGEMGCAFSEDRPNNVHRAEDDKPVR
jgi:hypothetical protein